uniref:Uncharacterized protein n=1 Tax=Rhizophora mucronata TaxID=61149 RepID=A0A2P2R2A7_RHIMU
MYVIKLEAINTNTDIN